MDYMEGLHLIVIIYLAGRTLVLLEASSICQFWLTKDGLTIKEFHPLYKW